MIRLPAEWEKQSTIMVAWPHATGDFNFHLEAVENTYCAIAKTITQHQKLIIICHDDAHQQRIKRLVEDENNIYFIQASVNDIWVRDTAFITVEQDDKPLLLNFRFNGWGQKYPYHDDNALNHKLLVHRPFQHSPYQDIDFILEGGSIESDGNGTLLTTKQCLLNPNRNSSLTQHEIEAQLQQHLGIARILWLSQENLAGDDTDAHIDTLARFCNQHTIAYTTCENPDDRHFRSLKQMETQLQSFKQSNGESYQLVPLPLPKPIYDEDNQRLPANYANFLIINDAVLMPVYDDPLDFVACKRVGECFPEREVIPIPCRSLVHQYGSLHCMTMQFTESALNFS
jgi:agmatine/peptidylarginine deiminase